MIFALYFAFQGGEYGTLDLRELRKEAAEESTAVVGLQHVVDSLGRLAVAIEKDPAMQERVARERFGMLAARGSSCIAWCRQPTSVSGNRKSVSGKTNSVSGNCESVSSGEREKQKEWAGYF